MKQEKHLIVWKNFGNKGMRLLWKQINDLYADGWKAVEDPIGNRLNQATITTGMFRCTFVRDSVELTLQHLTLLNKVVEFEEFAKEEGIEYPEELCKFPMKFKKFLREHIQTAGGIAFDASEEVIEEEEEVVDNTEVAVDELSVDEPNNVEPDTPEPATTETVSEEKPKKSGRPKKVSQEESFKPLEV